MDFPGDVPVRGLRGDTSAFAGLLAAAGVLGRALDRDPQCQSALDRAVLSAATFKATRTLAPQRRRRTSSTAPR